MHGGAQRERAASMASVLESGAHLTSPLRDNSMVWAGGRHVGQKVYIDVAAMRRENREKATLM